MHVHDCLWGLQGSPTKNCNTPGGDYYWDGKKNKLRTTTVDTTNCCTHSFYPFNSRQITYGIAETDRQQRPVLKSYVKFTGQAADFSSHVVSFLKNIGFSSHACFFYCIAKIFIRDSKTSPNQSPQNPRRCINHPGDSDTPMVDLMKNRRQCHGNFYRKDRMFFYLPVFCFGSQNFIHQQ